MIAFDVGVSKRIVDGQRRRRGARRPIPRGRVTLPVTLYARKIFNFKPPNLRTRVYAIIRQLFRSGCDVSSSKSLQVWLRPFVIPCRRAIVFERHE